MKKNHREAITILKILFQFEEVTLKVVFSFRFFFF